MKGFEGSDKRKHPRYDAKNLRIILKDDKNFKGERIRDISLGGIFVRMDEPFPVGTNLTLTLDPKLGLGEIKLDGEVIWVSQGEGNFDKGIGIMFKEMPSRVEEKLTKLFKTMSKI